MSISELLGQRRHHLSITRDGRRKRFPTWMRKHSHGWQHPVHAFGDPLRVKAVEGVARSALKELFQ